MDRASNIKAGGYLTSIASVVLLAIPSLKNAGQDPTMLTCLLAGAVTSISGMGLRWRAHRLEQRQKASGQRLSHSAKAGA